MALSEDDISRIEKIILNAGETVRRDTIQFQENKLRLQVYGSDRDGSVAIQALMRAGLNVYSDANLDTQENYASWNEGASFSLVTLTLRPGALWRS